MAGRSSVDRPQAGPLLVFGPRSLDYDFGPEHPLSPRRFGPGIDLLRAVGAEPGLTPELATDEELEWLHAPEYVAAVRAFSADPRRRPDAGIGPGDDPPFKGMHEAAATVAGGSIRAMEAILRGDVEHAYHPGGGLHHATADRASGFCIYNDVALAIARARRDGLRVMYMDFDVHHGDGVQALHAADPGVLTVSFHESGRSLFPGTGFVDELGEGTAAGTSVNVPLDAFTGPDAWLAAVRAVVPPLAAAFGPDVVVSQHGADGHVWDPLAHLSLTTTAMGAAARLVDRMVHRHAGGRWLATGGGGYAVYRVVPRVWALTWLAGAHRDVPDRLPASWRDRWNSEAASWREVPLPEGFEDGPGLPGQSASTSAIAHDTVTVELVRLLTVPALLRVAEWRGWWRADEGGDLPGSAWVVPEFRAAAEPALVPESGAAPTIVTLDAATAEHLTLAPRTVPPASVVDGLALLRAAIRAGATATGAVSGEWLVGVALAAPAPSDGPANRVETATDQLVALGVAPGWRRRGVATALLRALVAEQDRLGRSLVAIHTAAERDAVEPLPRLVRREIGERLARAAGMSVVETRKAVAEADPDSMVVVRFAPGTPTEVEGQILARLGGH